MGQPALPTDLKDADLKRVTLGYVEGKDGEEGEAVVMLDGRAVEMPEEKEAASA
jgi:hypothetical protein